MQNMQTKKPSTKFTSPTVSLFVGQSLEFRETRWWDTSVHQDFPCNTRQQTHTGILSHRP